MQLYSTMEINKETIEAVLILLYKLEELDACEALFEVYKKHFIKEENTLH